jgi:hypothetical protein
MAAHNSFGERDQIIESTGGLHRGERGDDRDDHAQHSRWWATRRQCEHKNENRESDTRNRAEGNASEPGANQNAAEENDQFKRDSHRNARVLACGSRAFLRAV